MSSGSIMAIDVGLKRIGIALSFDASVAFPQPAVLRKNRNQAAFEIQQLLADWNIELLVVGLPKGGQSAEEMGRRIRHFVGLIAFKGEVHYVDEYGTSLEAKERMRGTTKHTRDGKIDSMAALIILERFLQR
jgi:putative Holliday junction resolvase